MPITNRKKVPRAGRNAPPPTKERMERLRKEGAQAMKDEIEGEVIGALVSSPAPDIEAIAKKHGLSQAKVRGIQKVLQTSDLALNLELRRVTQGDLLANVDDGLIRALERVRATVELAPTRDAVYAAKELFNMRQLINGEPTTIMNVEDRRALNELLPRALEEAKRRGFLFDGNGNIIRGPAPLPAADVSVVE